MRLLNGLSVDPTFLQVDVAKTKEENEFEFPNNYGSEIYVIKETIEKSEVSNCFDEFDKIDEYLDFYRDNNTSF